MIALETARRITGITENWFQFIEENESWDYMHNAIEDDIKMKMKGEYLLSHAEQAKLYIH